MVLWFLLANFGEEPHSLVNVPAAHLGVGTSAVKQESAHFFLKAQIVNIFGFLNKESPLGTLCGYSYNEGKSIFTNALVLVYKILK